MDSAPQRRSTDSLAVVSLVLGILAFVVLPIVGAVLAIVFGIQSRHRIADDPTLDGHAMATAGVVLGAVQLALFVAAILFLAALRPG